MQCTEWLPAGCQCQRQEAADPRGWCAAPRRRGVSKRCCGASSTHCLLWRTAFTSTRRWVPGCTPGCVAVAHPSSFTAGVSDTCFVHTVWPLQLHQTDDQVAPATGSVTSQNLQPPPTCAKRVACVGGAQSLRRRRDQHTPRHSTPPPVRELSTCDVHTIPMLSDNYGYLLVDRATQQVSPYELSPQGFHSAGGRQQSVATPDAE